MGELTAEEIGKAENIRTKDTQQDLTSVENFGKTRERLNVTKQNEPLLVCKGRLEKSNLNGETRFPTSLPKNDKFTELVILDRHCRVHHVKVRGTLGELR